MAYSILGLITGLGIARSKDLEGVSAAKVAVIPGLLGFNIVSLVLAKVVADQEAESLPPPDAGKAMIEVTPTSHSYGNVNVGSSACKMFVVRNIGTAGIEVTVTLSGAGADTREFKIVSSGGSKVVIPPGEAHFVEVSFAPASKSLINASLDIISNGQEQLFIKIELSGGTDVDPVTKALPAMDIESSELNTSTPRQSKKP